MARSEVQGDGRPLRSKLGVFPEMTVEQARDAALAALNVMHQGGNTAAIRRAQREAPTLQALFDHWLAQAKLRKRTWQDEKRQFNKYMDRLKNRKLADIDTAAVAQWHAKLGKDSGPYRANRCRALLSAMFGVAHEVGHTGPNPCTGVKKFKESSRERFLQPDELRPFFQALADEPTDWRDFWLLCLFCGARRGNVAGMAWKDIDLAAGVWYLPGQTTKNGLPMAVVLVERFILTMKTLLSCLLLVPFRRDGFQRELDAIVGWYNHYRPHTWLGGKTPDEVYYRKFPANRRPRFEPRDRWARGSPCAKPWALVRGKPGAKVTLEVSFHRGRRHLPIVTVKRAA